MEQNKSMDREDLKRMLDVANDKLRGNVNQSSEKKKVVKATSLSALGDITAPYNFVPLSEKVVTVEDGGAISHDLPYEDGISAVIECALINDSPVYVRNGHIGDSHSNTEAHSFFSYTNADGKQRYAIPGSSLRGMIRSVVEIASFGKMGPGVDDRRYSIRDLSGELKEIYRERMVQAKAGWLRQKNDQWEIVPCEYAKISFDTLQGYARCRNALRNEESFEKRYEPLTGKLDVTAKVADGAVESIGKREGAKKGRIVVTGHVGGKKNEFFFYDPKEDDQLVVEKRVRTDFESIHKKADNWEYWRPKLEKGGEMPVFYLMDGEKVSSIGLAKMFRLACDKSVHNAVGNVSPDHLEPDSVDLAQAIFGYLDNRKGENSLKGRAWFTHAVAEKASPVESPVQGVLGGPKPSYFPNYLRQQYDPNQQGRLDSGSEYSTYMNPQAKVRGWKRYPVASGGVRQLSKAPNDREDLETSFIPLSEGTRFAFKAVVHNLRPHELGALLWALTWGGDATKRHSLGIAKAYGYGQVGITVKTDAFNDNSGTPLSTVDLLKAYSDWMNERLCALEERKKNVRWGNSPQMKELLAMADPEVGGDKRDRLKHMKLNPDKKIDEFRDRKNKGRILMKYTIL